MRGIAWTAVVVVAALTFADRTAAHVDLHDDPTWAFPPAIAAVGTGASGGLPQEWCGTQTAKDDVEHEFGDPTEPKIKVVEAYPSDGQPSPAVRDLLQHDISRAVSHIAGESGGRKSLRIDLGTSCGPQYVDILTIQMPGSAAMYSAMCSASNGGIHMTLREAMPDFAGPRKFAGFFSGLDCGGVAGNAEAPADDRPGPENEANDPGHVALLYVDQEDALLHEIGHTLGAVQRSAPHQDGTRHCYDQDDVMCYPYTSYLPGQSPLRPCIASGLVPFDCNKDDYFAPSPAAGSYLATHWNLFNSIYLCELDACTPPPADPDPEPPADPDPDPPADDEEPPAQRPTPSPDPPAEETPEPTPTAAPASTPAPTPAATTAPPRQMAAPPALRLSMTARRRGRTLRISGRATTCDPGAAVRISVRTRKRRLVARSLELRGDCRFSGRIALGRRGRLTVRASLPGAEPVVRVVR